MFNTTYKEIYSMFPNKPYPVHDIYEDCRTILADLQIEMFNRINTQLYKSCHYNKPRKHHEMIKKLLIEFIIDNKDSKIVSAEPFELNLEAFYAIKQNCNISNNNKPLDEYIITYFEDLLSNISNTLTNNNRANGNNPIINYIYVTQRKDGMVCVVGKSHFKYEFKGNEYKLVKNQEGDLFKKMDEDKGSGKILSSLYIKDNELKKQYSTCREFLDDYLYTAWIIPVLLNEHATSQLEEYLGRYLINQNVPILNLLSHTFK
ncbi:TPA: hypothetical protein RUU76_001086 [Staphylococcus aureus]|nr:hypothetical protein [Staphylococcus aureus]